MVVRATLTSAIVVLLLIAAMLVWAPGVVIPWPQVCFGLLIVPLPFLFQSFLFVMLPVFVTISEDGVHFRAAYFAPRTIRAHDILSVGVDNSRSTPMLRLEYVWRKKGSVHPLAFGISPKIDRATLEEVMQRLIQSVGANEAPWSQQTAHASDI